MTHIRVTGYHIAHGKSDSDEECPVALALLDAGYEEPSVGARTVVLGAFIRQVVVLPPAVTRKIRAFDHGVNIRPFEFELEVEP